jgi:hypothetical protein
VQDATADVLDENDVARPFIEQCLVEDAEAVTPIPEVENALKKFIGGLVMAGDQRFDRIMDGIKARWSSGRRRVNGERVRGFVGVRIKLPETS